MFVQLVLPRGWLGFFDFVFDFDFDSAECLKRFVMRRAPKKKKRDIEIIITTRRGIHFMASTTHSLIVIYPIKFIK